MTKGKVKYYHDDNDDSDDDVPDDADLHEAHVGVVVPVDLVGEVDHLQADVHQLLVGNLGIGKVIMRRRMIARVRMMMMRTKMRRRLVILTMNMIMMMTIIIVMILNMIMLVMAMLMPITVDYG